MHSKCYRFGKVPEREREREKKIKLLWRRNHFKCTVDCQSVLISEIRTRSIKLEKLN